MSWLIYKHTNKVNGKVYIGQTQQSTDLRWREGKGYKNSIVFSCAIAKYGWHDFDHEIIESNIKTKKLADAREVYWISFFRSYVGFDDCNGYNMTLGGHNREHAGYSVLQIDPKSMNVVSEFPSMSEASRSIAGTEKSASQIRLCCEGQKITCKGYYWCYKKNYTPNWVPKVNKNTSPVFQIDDDFEVIREYSTISEACMKNNFSLGTIVQCCQRKCRKANGYYWCYKQDYSISWKPADVSFKRNERIFCFEKNEIYKNAKEASIKTGVKREAILKCCSHRGQNATKNLHFCFYSDKDKYLIQNNKNESPVVCINTGKHYKTILDASLETGINQSHISGCCRGERKTAGKLSWCYETNYNKLLTANVPKEKPIICIETNKRYESTMAVTRELGIPHSTLCGALRRHTATHGFHFCYESQINDWHQSAGYNKKAIVCVETKEVYECCKEAEQKTGINRSNIHRAQRSGGTAGGFHWKYVDADISIPSEG